MRFAGCRGHPCRGRGARSPAYNFLAALSRLRAGTAVHNITAMHKPRFFDQLAMELGDDEAFTVAFARGRRAFQPQHVEAKWARDRDANIKHIKLEVALDFDAKKIAGTATHRLSAITGPLERLEFDAAELEIKAVRAAGELATFETSDGKLRIAMPRALGAGEEIEIAIDYAGHPRRGLYFVRPRRRLSEQAAAGVDAGRRRGLALLVPLLRLPEQSYHQRNDRDRAGKVHGGFQRRPDRHFIQCGGEDPHVSLAS